MGWSKVTTTTLKTILSPMEGNISIGAGSDDQYTESAATAFITDIENTVKLKLSKMYDPDTLDGDSDVILKSIVTRLTCYELYVGVYPEGENPSQALRLWHNKYSEILDNIASPDDKGYFLEIATLTTFGASKKAQYASTAEIASYNGHDEDEVFDTDLSDEYYMGNSDDDE